MDLVDDDQSQITEKPAASTRRDISMTSSDSGVVISSAVGSRRNWRRSLSVRIAVPNEPPQPDHLGIQAQAFGLVVEQRLDRGDVDRRHRRGRVVDHLRQHRENRRLGFSAGGRREDDDVSSVEDRLARLLLNRSKARPAQTRNDRLLQTRREAGKDAHQTSSFGTRSSSASGISSRRPDSACSSSGLRTEGVNPYSAAGS